MLKYIGRACRKKYDAESDRDIPQKYWYQQTKKKKKKSVVILSFSYRVRGLPFRVPIQQEEEHPKYEINISGTILFIYEGMR